MNEIYTILGYSRVVSKKSGQELFVFHLSVQRKGVTGYAVETVFVPVESVVGGQVELKKHCNVFYNKSGYCCGVQLLDN